MSREESFNAFDTDLLGLGFISNTKLAGFFSTNHESVIAWNKVMFLLFFWFLTIIGEAESFIISQVISTNTLDTTPFSYNSRSWNSSGGSCGRSDSSDFILDNEAFTAAFDRFSVCRTSNDIIFLNTSTTEFLESFVATIAVNLVVPLRFSRV